jgi:ankyrin repeat protein
LILTAYYNFPELCRLLLESGAQLELVDSRRRTAFDRAVEQGSREVATMLAAAGASRTPEYDLLFGAQIGDLERVRHRLADGIDVNVQDQGLDSSRRGSAIVWAAGFGNVGIVEELLRHGASLVECQHAKKLAAILGHDAVASLLGKVIESN